MFSQSCHFQSFQSSESFCLHTAVIRQLDSSPLPQLHPIASGKIRQGFTWALAYTPHKESLSQPSSSPEMCLCKQRLGYWGSCLWASVPRVPGQSRRGERMLALHLPPATPHQASFLLSPPFKVNCLSSVPFLELGVMCDYDHKRPIESLAGSLAFVFWGWQRLFCLTEWYSFHNT